MEREELKTRIDAALGSTKLTLSERTINDFLDDALAGITDDAAVTDDFVTRKANMLKSIDGNLHSDVSEQVKQYKANYKPVETKPAQEPEPNQKPESKNDDVLAKELEELKKKMQGYEDDRKKAEESRKAEEERMQLKEAFEARFNDAGVKVNSYVLKQTLRDFNVAGKMDERVQALESKYYENLKEAGFDYDSPRAGGISANPNGVQGKRDALKNELRSRGLLPKQESKTN